MDIVAAAQSAAFTSAESLWALGGNFVAIAVLAVALTIFTLRSGRAALLSLIISLYAGYAVYSVFPYTDALVGLGDSAAVRFAITLGLYAAASVVPYLLLRRVVTSDFLSIGFVGLLILSALTAAFLLAVAYQLFGIADVYAFPASIEALFAPAEYFFWWFIAPLLGLMFLAR